MSRLGEELMEAVKEMVEAEQANNELTHTALSIFKADTGGWFIGRIMYNPVSLKVGPLEKVGEGDIKNVIDERFRILVAEKVF